MIENLPPMITIISEQILYTEGLTVLLEKELVNFRINSFSRISTKTTLALSDMKPQIILIDLNSFHNHVWDFVKKSCGTLPQCGIIMLANTNESIYRQYAEKSGASGYVLKSSPKELLVAAVKIVLKGGQFFDPGTSFSPGRGLSDRFQQDYNLSSREIEVVQLIKDGFSTKDIAGQLNLSFHTIETHRKNIYNKLNINKVTALFQLVSEISKPV